MFLLDTNIISAVAPLKRDRPRGLVEWMDAASDHLFMSVVTASEVAAGIAAAERTRNSPKAELLREWWNVVEHLYAARFLPVDLQVAHAIGRIMDRCRALDPGYEDIAIAATAECHGLTVLTAHEKHFRPLGVPWINPLRQLPPLPR